MGVEELIGLSIHKQPTSYMLVGCLCQTFHSKLMRKENRSSWAIILIFFGVLFLIKHLCLFPESIRQFLFDFRNYPFYAGIIFLLTNKKNFTIGITLLIIGVLFRLSDVIRLTQHVSEFIWPSLLIIGGIVMLLGRKKR